MKILGIDTSTSNLSLAVLNDSDEIIEKDIYCERKLSSLLIPEINNILKRAKINLESLDAFSVGLGPGSFTGLRIGLAAIKAFALVTSRPVIGVSSLDILARNSSDTNQSVCAIIDAKRDKVYSCIYENKNGGFKKKTDYLLIEVKDLIKKIKKPTLFVGDAVAVYAKLIKTKLGKKARFSDEKHWFPRAADLIILAQEKIKEKKFDNPDKLVPLYLYPKECQIKR